MTNKYSLEILDASNGEWMTTGLFSEFMPPEFLAKVANMVWVEVEGAADVAIMNLETNTFVFSVNSPYEDDEVDLDWGYNEDMGYDPYMGCYTDDC